jgi:lipoate-protein ligase A
MSKITPATADDASRYMEIDRLVLRRVFEGADFALEVYEPRDTRVVLGRSVDLAEIDESACGEDGVIVVRRAGGGGAVVLSQGTVVVSVAGITALPYRLREHMNMVNGVIMSALEELGVTDLSIRGISDIALGNRKILGSSLYRRREVVLYQGSLLVDPDFSLMERYLRHPRREPEYRRGRGHRAFVTSLRESGHSLSVERIVETLKLRLASERPWPSNRR